jgi:hypothetical protein
VTTTRREQLAAIRATYGAGAAADAAGIPKRVRVKKAGNASGYGYRTLSKKNRADRLQRIIGGSTRRNPVSGTIERSYTKITPATSRRIASALEGKTYANANAELAIAVAERERAYARAEATRRGLPITPRMRPLSEKSKQALRDHAAMGEWKQFKAAYESAISVRRAL